ncbi:MAG: chromate transporter [Thermodesulfobacteriota bacterium]
MKHTAAGLFAACLLLGLTSFGPGRADRAGMFLRDRFGPDAGSAGEESRYLEIIPGSADAQRCAHAGYRLKGVPGAAAALLGYCLPGFTIMAALAAALPRLGGVAAVQGALAGLGAAAPAVCLLGGADILRRLARAPLLWAMSAACGMLFFLGLKAFAMILGGAVIAVLLLPDPEGLPDTPGKTHYRWGLPIGLFLGFAATTGACFWADPALGRLFMGVAKAETYGLGGLGGPSLLFADAVRLRHWMEAVPFAQLMALAQAVPGPSMALAAFAGYAAKGVAGAAAAFAAACMASLFLFLSAVPAARLIASSAWAWKAAQGASAVLGGLCIGLAGRFAVDAAWDLPRACIAGSAALALGLRVNPAWAALAAALAGAFLPGHPA